MNEKNIKKIMPEPGIEPGTPKWKTKEIIWDYIFLPTAAFNTSNCDYVKFLLRGFWFFSVSWLFYEKIISKGDLEC